METDRKIVDTVFAAQELDNGVTEQMNLLKFADRSAQQIG
jgi:hypothetical protein